MASGCAGPDDADAHDPPPGCTAPDRTFRIDDVSPPGDGEVGLDLDGDGAIDDRAGELLRTLFHTYADQGAADAWRAQLQERLAGRTAWFLELPACAEARMDQGLPLGALADLTGAAEDDWRGADPLVLDVTGRGDELDGVVAGALSAGYQAALAAALAPFLDGLLAAGDSPWAAALDTDRDGHVTADELLRNTAFRIFTAPDLDTDGDGLADALSFGLSIHGAQVPGIFGG